MKMENGSYMIMKRWMGHRASCFPENFCGELTLPLGIEGPHKIFVGVNYTKTNHPHWSPYGTLSLKLTGDYGYQRVGTESQGQHAGHIKLKTGVKNEIFKSIQEAYWKTADLSGKSLIFRQPAAPYDRKEHGSVTNLSYLRLVPLSAEEKAEWKSEEPRDETKNLAQIFCTGQLTGHTRGSYTFHPTDESWFRDELVPLIDSDFGIMVFESLRGSYCSYKTRLGYIGREDGQWQDEWLDPVETFTRLCHEKGLKMFISMRMIAAQYPMNKAPIARAKHYWDNPQWAKRDREGMPTTGLSLAFPEVRVYWLELLRENLEYGIDGILLHFNRSNPFVMYEEPVIQSFREKYGEDPRNLSKTDPRYVQHCADLTTDFIREVRDLINEKPGRELGITIYGKPHKYDPVKEGFHPLRYNCDVERWITDKLVDYIMPSPNIDLDLIRKWRQMGGEDLHIWPDLMPRTQPAEMYAALARQYYEAGADGFCTWDGERRTQRLSEWAAVRLLGHRELLGKIEIEGKDWYRRTPMHKFAGFSVEESFHDG